MKPNFIIVVISIALIQFVFSNRSFSQSMLIKGLVSDSLSNNPMVGVSVSLEGSNKGTLTEESGSFSLEVVKGDVLVFSTVGYKNKRVSVEAENLRIELVPSSYKLDQLVVVGYGRQKETDVISAVSNMKGEEISSIPISSLSNGLGGRLSGVIFKQANGEPGSDQSSVYIRGISSMGSNAPLLIVDGIPRNYENLDPNTIESFSILKDAAAVAPYGVAGANGVILVTTKRGNVEKTEISYHGYVGFQNATVLPHYLAGYDYAKLRNEAAKNSGTPPAFTEQELEIIKTGSDPDRYPTLDNVYGQLITRNAPLMNHNLEVAGGTEKIKYYTSFGYQYQAGMWGKTHYDKFNLAINLDFNLSKSTTLSVDLNGMSDKKQTPSTITERLFELIGWTYAYLGPVRFSNGLSGPSIIYASIFEDGYTRTNNTQLFSQISIDQKIPFIPGLTFRGKVAYDPNFNTYKLWHLPTHIGSLDVSTSPYTINDGIFGDVKPSLEETFNNTSNITYQTGFQYEKSFEENHNVNGLILFEARDNNGSDLTGTRQNYNIYIDEMNMGSSDLQDISLSGSSFKSRQVGLVYRLGYNFRQKYFVEATGRYDGSYFFDKGHRFGFFPAASVGWRLSEEDFLKDNVSWINDLKIRGSYGETGSLAGAPFQFLTSYSVLGPDYAFNGGAVQGLRENAEPNIDITWERAKKFDFGLDALLFQGRLSFTMDYFSEKRSNMLLSPSVTVPLEYGIGLSQINSGIMKNRGIEVSMNYSQRVNKDLEFFLGGNVTYAKNKLIQVFETPVTFNNPNRRRTGRPLGTQFGFEAIGFFNEGDFNSDGSLKNGIAVQPWGEVAPGDLRYKDMNNDGVINDDDITVIGNPDAAPLIVYGITPHIAFKGFSLDVLLQGAAKTNFYQRDGAVWPFWNGMGAYKKNLNYWTPDNPNAKNPRITNAPTLNNTQTSSFWMANGNYLRLKSLTLAYDFPQMFVSKIKLENLRLYFAGQNLFTWTKMVDFDPETIPSTWYYSRNSGWNYPQQRVYSVGIDVTF